MGRKLRSRLDLLYPEFAERVIDNQYKQKEHHDNSKPGRKFFKGDTVYVTDFTASSDKWSPGVIQDVRGPLSYEVKLTNGTSVCHHVPKLGLYRSHTQSNSDRTNGT